MPFTQLTYHSRNLAQASGGGLLAALRDILAVSQRNNARDAITGYLIGDRDWFAQILEGEADKVRATYNRIQSDPRHGQVTLVSRREIRARSFPQWSMGGALRTPETEEIFLRHGAAGAFDPRRLSAPSILAVAMDLQDCEIARRLGLRAAS